MEKVKETLELLREIELCETKYSTRSDLDWQKRYKLCLKIGSFMKKRGILQSEIPEYKSILKTEYIMPSPEEQISTLYKNVRIAYHHWFSNGIEFNEYFKDAWEKIFQYVSSSVISFEPSISDLKMIYYQVQTILNKKKGVKHTTIEDEFLGNFFTCFPNSHNNSVLCLANNYLREITVYLATMCPKELVNLSLLDKIELGHIWTSNDNQILKRKRID